MKRITKPLSGKVAVVAGSTRGAGRGIACMLGEAGATVYCTGRSVRGNLPNKKRPETIEDTARMVTEHGGQGIAVQVDHTSPEQVRALFEQVATDARRLDVLVNNANGDDLLEWKPYWKLSLENGFKSVQRGINTHLITAHAALPLMLKHKGGLIVGITDEGGGTFFYGFVKQSVMKTAELLAPELIPHGITAVSMTPGFLRSEAVLEHYGVTESNWRDAIQQDPYFAASETPFFIGRAVAALAADRRAILKAGMLLRSGELAQEYGINDVDGSRPNLYKTWEPLIEAGWRKVVERVRSEFEKHGVDPEVVLEEDRKNLTFRARLSTEPPVWLKEFVGLPGVAHGNPDHIAAAFYKRFEELR